MLAFPTLVTLLLALPATLARDEPHRLPSTSLDSDVSSSTPHRPRSLAARASSSCSSKPPIMAQYYPAWQSGQSPAQVDWKRADIAYYFAAPTTSKGLALPEGATLDGMKQFVATAKANGKKAGLTLGGWEGSVYFSDLVATVKNRASFANTVKSWVTTYGFMAVSFDWEFIGKQGAGNNKVRSSDAANLIKFFATLRQTLGSSITISADVPAGGIVGADGNKLTDVSKFAANLDYVSLMTYDFYGPWSKTTGAHAALYTCNASSYSVDQSVRDWMSRGLPACKILTGMPGYSHRFRTAKTKLATTTYNGKKSISFQALASPGIDDDTSTTRQLVSQGLLSADLSKGTSGYTRSFDSCTQTPVLFNGASDKKIFITYEDQQSFKAKAAYAKKMGLAGIVVYDSTGPAPSMFDAAASGLGHA
ncbi:hypothetical protein JCM10212_006583 [Sporobolomyces blumeae]